MRSRSAGLSALQKTSASIAAFALAACYSTLGGVEPPRDRLYFPTGLAVSPDGTRLFAVNSNFDLQFDGGTLEAFDLRLLRVVANEQAAAFGTSDCVSGLFGGSFALVKKRIGDPCAAPTSAFIRGQRLIGAFATDLLFAPIAFEKNAQKFRRLFFPVRGSASISWADVPEEASGAQDIFNIDCGGDGRRCDTAHQAGNNPTEPNNTRGIAMPGEPFGLAFSENATVMVVTHQTAAQTSLLTTGFPVLPLGEVSKASTTPSLQFVVDEMPLGGTGIVAIPHDPDAFAAEPSAKNKPRPAFLQTSRASANLSLIRQFADVVLSDAPDGGALDGGALIDGGAVSESSLLRPFLVREATLPSGVDSRGIAIDASPRFACKARVKPAGGARTASDVARDTQACARIPARIYIANRSPASLLIGEVGDASSTLESAYNPDSIRIFESIPLENGPSKVFVAPIVDSDGRYAMRVFITCFDSAQVFIYDPEARAIEASLRVGLGPFAMAFDPFDAAQAGANARVGILRDTTRFNGNAATVEQRAYRYAYLASFTTSVVQVIDLDRSRPDSTSFEHVVLSLGEPTLPKGSN
jgi:hypothetical protein